MISECRPPLVLVCRAGKNYYYYYYYGTRYGGYPERSRRDPKFSIWISVDPLAEMYPEWSSYNYVMQNPINYTDPPGMGPDWVRDDGGNTYYWDSEITTEKEAKDTGVKYSGKTTSEAIKKRIAHIYIWNEFEEILDFDFKRYYDDQVKEAYYEILQKNVNDLEDKYKRINEARRNKDRNEYDAINDGK